MSLLFVIFVLHPFFLLLGALCCFLLKRNKNLWRCENHVQPKTRQTYSCVHFCTVITNKQKPNKQKLIIHKNAHINRCCCNSKPRKTNPTTSNSPWSRSMGSLSNSQHEKEKNQTRFKKLTHISITIIKIHIFAHTFKSNNIAVKLNFGKIPTPLAPGHYHLLSGQDKLSLPYSTPGHYHLLSGQDKLSLPYSTPGHYHLSGQDKLSLPYSTPGSKPQSGLLEPLLQDKLSLPLRPRDETHWQIFRNYCPGQAVACPPTAPSAHRKGSGAEIEHHRWPPITTRTKSCDRTEEWVVTTTPLNCSYVIAKHSKYINVNFWGVCNHCNRLPTSRRVRSPIAPLFLHQLFAQQRNVNNRICTVDYMHLSWQCIRG